MDNRALFDTILDMRQFADVWDEQRRKFLTDDGQEIREDRMADYEQAKDNHAWPALENLDGWATALAEASGMKRWTLIHTRPGEPGLATVHLSGTSLGTALAEQARIAHPEWAQRRTDDLIADYLALDAPGALVIKGHRRTWKAAERITAARSQDNADA